MLNSYLEIFRYTIKYKLHTFLVVLCNMFFVIFNLLSLVLFIPVLQLIFKDPEQIPLVSKPEFNWGIPDVFLYVKDYYNYTMTSMVKSEPLHALLFVCVSVMLAFFFKNLFRYGAVWFQSELRMAVVRDVRNKLFKKSMQLPLAYHSNERKGDLMSRMVSDVNELEIAVVCLLELLFREPFAVIINIATLIYLSPSLSLFQTSVMYSSMDEGIEGVRIVKAFNAAAFIISRFKKTNLKHQKLVTRTARKKNLSPLLNETIGAGVLLSLVWFGGSMILGGEKSALSGEVFMTFIIVFSQFLRPVQNISKNISNMIKSRASQDRINEILNLSDVITDAPDATSFKEFKTQISFEDVGFTYDTAVVLEKINVTIEKGQNIALVGESGSGKTTLINLIPRFYDVTSGSIKIDGLDIDSIKIKDLRANMALVSQDPILFNSSVIENIAFGEQAPDLERVKEAARIANAHNFIAQMQNGYQSIIGERGSLLSGGQKQRLSIARAMYKNPEILILDEATSALDLESEKLVQEALDRVMKNRTCIVIAHRLSTIRKSDLILVLDKGKVVERGSHDVLLQKEGFYKKLFDLQTS